MWNEKGLNVKMRVHWVSYYTIKCETCPFAWTREISGQRNVQRCKGSKGK